MDGKQFLFSSSVPSPPFAVYLAYIHFLAPTFALFSEVLTISVHFVYAKALEKKERGKSNIKLFFLVDECY